MHASSLKEFRIPAAHTASLESSCTLAARHRVHWQVYPEYRVVNDSLVKVGFELLLLGTHDHPSHLPAPGCDECVMVYRALSCIASFVLPREARPTLFEIAPFEAALVYPAPGTERLEVALRIRLVHRSDSQLPIDDCQRTCLAEIEGRLQQLGAKKAS